MRHCTLPGCSKLEEEIVTCDDGLRRFPYRIVSGDMPLDVHLGTVDVLPDGGGALVICATDITPDELRPQMDGVIAAGLGGLKAHLEARAVYGSTRGWT